jgi:hypothetical protein
MCVCVGEWQWVLWTGKTFAYAAEQEDEPRFHMATSVIHENSLDAGESFDVSTCYR